MILLVNLQLMNNKGIGLYKEEVIEFDFGVFREHLSL